MIGRLLRGGFSHRTALQATGQRYFSAKGVHSIFPATLVHYCPRKRVRLYDHAESDDRPDDLLDESVIVEKDGLVYPKPNTRDG